jgi:hypothetical protein
MAKVLKCQTSPCRSQLGQLRGSTIESLQQNHRSNKAKFISILCTTRGTPSSNTRETKLSLRTRGRLTPEWDNTPPTP